MTRAIERAYSVRHNPPNCVLSNSRDTLVKTPIKTPKPQDGLVVSYCLTVLGGVGTPSPFRGGGGGGGRAGALGATAQDTLRWGGRRD